VSHGKQMFWKLRVVCLFCQNNLTGIEDNNLENSHNKALPSRWLMSKENQNQIKPVLLYQDKT